MNYTIGEIMKRIMMLATVAAMVAFSACGSGDGSESASQDAPSGAATASGLSEWQMTHGVGPITKEITLGAIDPALAQKGEEIFEGKCGACHKVDDRYVGPELGTVTQRRTPEFILNMMLNPEEMVQKHPEVKALLAQYYTPMPNQNVTPEDALAVLEYLRSQEKDTTNNPL